MSTKSIFLFIGVQLISISFFAQVTPIWQNYIGGMNSEYITNTQILSNQDILVFGKTESTAGFDSSLGVNTNYSGGDFDIYLARFSGNGELIWWTLFGSNNADIITSVLELMDGTLWVCGYSKGTVPTSANSFRAVNTNSNTLDAFVTHFDSDGAFIEGTLIGGDGNEKASSLGLVDNKVVLIGTTTSQGLAVGSGIYDNELSTETAVFIAVLNSVSELQSFSYFEGNAEITAADLVDTAFQSSDGNFIFYDGTSATEGIATNSAEFPDPFDEQNGFIVKLTPLGHPVWGTYSNFTTYFRGIEALGSSHFATFGMGYQGGNQSTEGAFQTNILGDVDGFVTLWTQSGELVWSTYFGTNESMVFGEYITDIAFSNDRIFFSGLFRNVNNLSTNNAWISNIDNANLSSLSVFGWFNMAGELEYCSYVVEDETNSSVRSINVVGQKLLLGIEAFNLIEWTSSPNAGQHYSGETDVCLLAFDLATATDDLIIEEMVGVYPNPGTDELYFTGMNVIGASVIVYDSQGRVVLNDNLNSSLNISALDSGYYYGTITTSQGNGRGFRFCKL